MAADGRQIEPREVVCDRRQVHAELLGDDRVRVAGIDLHADK